MTQKIRVVVMHGYYGCDTGCCGHWVELETGEQLGGFHFSHPYSSESLEWARELAQEM